MLLGWLVTPDSLSYHSQCPLPGWQPEITKKVARNVAREGPIYQKCRKITTLEPTITSQAALYPVSPNRNLGVPWR